MPKPTLPKANKRMSRKAAKALIEDAFHTVAATSSGFAPRGAYSEAYNALLEAITGESFADESVKGGTGTSERILTQEDLDILGRGR